MASTWFAPPTANSSISSGVNNFLPIVNKNLKAIKDNLILKAIANASVQSPYLGPAAIGNIISKLIIGPTHTAEGGWAEVPNDSGGPTMRGVILTAFRGSFDDIFINTGIPEVATAARNFKSLGWMNGEIGSPGWELGRQVLYKVCSDASVASLWIYYFAAAKSNRYPAAIMSSEPYLGYLMHQGAWASGGGYFTMYNYDKEFKTIGYNASVSPAAATRLAVNFDGKDLTADNAFPVALKALAAHSSWIIADTQPSRKDSIFRTGWLNRLVFDPSMSWTHNLVGFVEAFENHQIATTEAEQKFLLAKAKYYKQAVINFPNLA